MIRVIIILSRAKVIALQEKSFNPFLEGVYEWIEVEDYKVRNSYYYCFLLDTGVRVPEPIVLKISNTFWRYFVPKTFWESVKKYL